jgi:hypothetical protein
MCPPRQPVPPPLGVMPRWLWEELNPDPPAFQRWARRWEVVAAVTRRIGTEFPIPVEWLEECEAFRETT